MDILNKKKIESLEKKIKSLEKKIENSEKKIKKSMETKISSLKEESKEWDEYRKWKEMKDSLPDIEEMYNLKELKRLTMLRNKLYPIFLEQEHTYNASVGNQFMPTKSFELTALSTKRKIEDVESHIKKKLEAISKLKTKKELIGVLKLYAISTEWLSPDWYK
jgi:cell division protein FtsL